MYLLKKLKIHNKEVRFKSDSRGIHTFVNSYSYLVLRKHQKIISQFDGIHCDGTLMMWFSRFFLNQKIKRVSFDMTSIAPETFKYAIEYNKSIYFLGSTSFHINGFVKVILENYPDLNIVGFRNGYIKADERHEVLESIKELDPHIVIIGMGTPLQDKFLSDLKQEGWNGLGFTCGGFIHQTSNGLNYYPKFINKYNLRWLYRLYDEPKLIKRFLKAYLIFPFVFFYDYFFYLKVDFK